MMSRSAMTEKKEGAAVVEDESLEGPDDKSESVKMTVTLPRNVAAFLRWKARIASAVRGP